MDETLAPLVPFWLTDSRKVMQRQNNLQCIQFITLSRTCIKCPITAADLLCVLYKKNTLHGSAIFLSMHKAFRQVLLQLRELTGTNCNLGVIHGPCDCSHLRDQGLNAA